MSPTNEELTASVEAHIKEILEKLENDTYDFTPSGLDISKPSPDIALSIDHTLLKPQATPDQIKTLCDEALKYGFKSCCVNPINIKLVTNHLKSPTSNNHANTIPCSVIGFPLGASTTATKCYETSMAVLEGACEIDMVIPIGHLKSKQYQYVYNDISSIIASAKGVPVKVILETSMLTKEEKIAACWLAAEAGAAFVKTSTGFGGEGATVGDVRLMRIAVAHREGVMVKASGGVKNFEQCVTMLRNGAHRIGTSSGVAIMTEGEGSGY
ncbi:hypothetical protein ABW19_dt0207790 [Dactylella cylindrospora]|nr:hypothetical protein ABW19_dt0207790 [Dactylella cylindrospora]